MVWGQPITLQIGEYTASETTLPNYTPSVWSGACSATGVVTVVEGENRTCHITNDDDAPSLTLTKIVSGGDAPASSWNLAADGPTPIDGNGGATSGASFVAGTYTLSELGDVPGYQNGTTWTCSGTGEFTSPNQIKLGLGKSAECSITNTFVPDPVIEVEKSSTTKLDHRGRSGRALHLRRHQHRQRDPHRGHGDRPQLRRRPGPPER